MADPVAQFLAPTDEPQEQIVHEAPVDPAPAPEPVSAPAFEEKVEGI
jgi:hypothetical protein